MNRKGIDGYRVIYGGVLKATDRLYPPNFIGRGDWIRTSDPLRPRQVRYQAALRPDNKLLRFADAKTIHRSQPFRW